MTSAKQIGDEIWAVPAFNAQVSAAGTVTGTTLDRMSPETEQGFESAVLLCATGTTGATGTPDSFSVTYAVEESADDSSWTAVAGATAEITEINTQARINLNLGPRSRYIRATATVAMTGGSSPTVVTNGVFVFGYPKKRPVGGLTS